VEVAADGSPMRAPSGKLKFLKQRREGGELIALERRCWRYRGMLKRLSGFRVALASVPKSLPLDQRSVQPNRPRRIGSTASSTDVGQSRLNGDDGRGHVPNSLILQK